MKKAAGNAAIAIVLAVASLSWSGCGRGRRSGSIQILAIPYNAHIVARTSGGATLVGDGPMELRDFSSLKGRLSKEGYQDRDFVIGPKSNTQTIVVLKPDSRYAREMLEAARTAEELVGYILHYPMLADAEFHSKLAESLSSAPYLGARSELGGITVRIADGDRDGSSTVALECVSDASNAVLWRFDRPRTSEDRLRVREGIDSWLVSDRFETPLYEPECATCFVATADLEYSVSKAGGELRVIGITYSYFDKGSGAYRSMIRFDPQGGTATALVP